MPLNLRTNLSFHLMWTSTFASGFGDRMAMLSAMTMLGANLPGADKSSITAGIDLFFFLPYVIWGPLAGWLADRLPRKWLMFFADELRGLMILYAFTLVPPGHAGDVPPDHQWKLYAMMLGLGFFAATFNPARTSTIPNVVGLNLLQRANAVVISMGVIGNLIGFLFGWQLAHLSVRWFVLFSALSYMVFGLFWIFLRTPAKRETMLAGATTHTGLGSVYFDLRDGLQYIRMHRPIMSLVGVSILFWAGTAVLMAAVTVVADHVSPEGQTVGTFALIGGAFGVGMLLGSVILGTANTRRGGEVLLFLGILGSGVSLIALAAIPMLWPLPPVAVALALVTGTFGGVLMITMNTLLQQMTADRIRGRVFGAKDMVSQIGKVVVAGAIWIAPGTDRIMIPLTIAFGVLLIVLACYGAWRYMMPSPESRELPWFNFCWRGVRLITLALHNLQVTGGHRVPKVGGALIVANHQAGLDPVLIQMAVRRRIRYLMGTENMIWALGWAWRMIKPIPVDRGQRNSGSVRAAVAALEAGDLVGIFPEGGFGQGGVRGMKAFNRGVAMIARRSKVPIIPVWVDGPSPGSVWLALFLPSRSRVTFGPPFTIAQLEQQIRDGQPDAAPKQIDTQISELIRRRMTDLSQSEADSGETQGKAD